MLVSVVPILELDAINLGGCCSNVHSLHDRGLLHHQCKVGGTFIEIGTVRELGFPYLYSSLERMLINSRQEETNASANVNTSISVSL